MISLELRSAAYRAAVMKLTASGGGSLCTSTIDAALEAVAPMICNATLEEAAKIAAGFVNPEWAGDDLSQQAEATAAAIRALATPQKL